MNNNYIDPGKLDSEKTSDQDPHCCNWKLIKGWNNGEECCTVKLGKA